eukprot:1042594-Prymnesium_polylepis.1
MQVRLEASNESVNMLVRRQADSDKILTEGKEELARRVGRIDAREKDLQREVAIFLKKKADADSQSEELPFFAVILYLSVYFDLLKEDSSMSSFVVAVGFHHLAAAGSTGIVRSRQKCFTEA